MSKDKSVQSITGAAREFVAAEHLICFVSEHPPSLRRRAIFISTMTPIVKWLFAAITFLLLSISFCFYWHSEGVDSLMPFVFVCFFALLMVVIFFEDLIDLFLLLERKFSDHD